MSIRIRTLVAFMLVTFCLAPCQAEVEAVKGKRYKLHRNCGPWMVMVGSFQEVPLQRRVNGGLSAQEAADELVFELRKQGLPAYSFELNNCLLYTSPSPRDS